MLVPKSFRDVTRNIKCLQIRLECKWKTSAARDLFTSPFIVISYVQRLVVLYATTAAGGRPSY